MAVKHMALAPKCTAFSKTTGQRCKQPAIRGGAVCMVHGGASPAAKAEAQRRLATLVDPALEVLYECLTSKKMPANVRLAAAKDILDRTGHKPIEKFSEVPWDGDPGTLPEEAMDRLTFFLERLAYGEDRARIEAARRRAQLEAGPAIEVTAENAEDKEVVGQDQSADSKDEW